ncbi:MULTISPECIES: hypothetical protein [unclassified Beijerinckia]|uniref:hypothetical protein n=1 Tax=unclassified Beijerinckia TaxID=2638183 RepID=UPI000894BFA9|nr:MULTISPECIES: hypothetical protein [unclassified Beijerinckia]MDH7798376.1 lysylphosphatidylglycerol synthetase-like protein (DUF2156 family) [Beijerinckia sp. GAS462]SED18856.1 hypothetical protein SAMN05443249_4674 [Beijerinckia sp. 28-YEA-48]
MDLNLTPFVWVHTIISLVAIIAGFPVIRDLLQSRADDPWTTTFLVTALATNITGFFLPATQFLPSHAVGILSTILLILAVLARYTFHYAGAWRWIYAAGVTLGQYFLLFVLVAQAFLKVHALQALAPTQSEPPFAIAQGVLLIIFLILLVQAIRHFRPLR